ncbi:DEAD/DEAH box helicase family protein, partial [Thiolapillus sp.]|uniref:DEAD/DEAH box helicase family protein n=1 Tax=Thiolapillus sp. TaxID=2017437 RepID=UPI003AF593BF
MSTIKFKFDGNLDYQQKAIESVVALFEGQPLANETYSVSIGTQDGGSQLSLGDEEFSNIAAVANQLVLTDELLLENLHKIQEDNNIPLQPKLAGHHFSVEMETGTGKTYVYLRTLFELNKRYGFTKFIVVVPSIAIR